MKVLLQICLILSYGLLLISHYLICNSQLSLASLTKTKFHGYDYLAVRGYKPGGGYKSWFFLPNPHNFLLRLDYGGSQSTAVAVFGVLVDIFGDQIFAL